MPADQLAFSFGSSTDLQLGQHDPIASLPLFRDEISRVWGLPLGERVEITFCPAFSVPAITGLLELRASPTRYPWDPHEPLALRIAGCDFISRDIERWTLI
jgi:hypothetical protein